MFIKKSITGDYHHNFSIAKPGLVAIFISARCKSKRQINSRSDEDLRVEIDHAPLGGLLHLNTSIGVGQVRVQTAQALEVHYPHLHPHSPDNAFQNSTILHVELLKDPLMNIRYVAAKIKFSQERWNLAGMADSERAGVLGTLYNLEDVTNPIAPHSQPGLNEFGKGAAMNYSRVKQWLGL